MRGHDKRLEGLGFLIGETCQQPLDIARSSISLPPGLTGSLIVVWRGTAVIEILRAINHSWIICAGLAVLRLDPLHITLIYTSPIQDIMVDQYEKVF